jgi:nitrous oxidase accessory protein
MESRDLVVEDNRAADNVRQGLLFRDVQDSQIRRNRLERNGSGMFFFSSTDNVIEDNLVLDNDIGLKIWAGTRRNRVEGNVIRGNREQVFYVGAEDQIWGESGRGNHWGDYLGWDQDGDGIGDRPYRVDSFTAGLLYRYPSAALLMRSPALETLSHLADRLPMLRTPTIVDRSPLLGDSGR